MLTRFPSLPKEEAKWFSQDFLYFRSVGSSQTYHLLPSNHHPTLPTLQAQCLHLHHPTLVCSVALEFDMASVVVCLVEF